MSGASETGSQPGPGPEETAGDAPLPAGRALGGCLLLLLLAVLAVLAWWALAPQPPVVTDGTQRVSPGMPELAAAQDGVFVLVTAVAGVLTAVGLLRLRPTAVRVLVVLVAALGGAWATALLGSALGGAVAGPRRSPALPDGVADRLAQGVTVAPSQLTLSADVALAVWPLTTALVVTTVLVLRLLRAPAPAGDAPVRED